MEKRTSTKQLPSSDDLPYFWLCPTAMLIVLTPEESTSVVRGESPEIARANTAPAPDGGVVNHDALICSNQ
ncbi:hypothetical protein EC9_03190 [Rosistilla ulvae]|uniref:Uncharacterized protein n=1 Tax=Rosistilla ulvae TaxID=1930277 RepID=A0A517LU57_9BACT|nr:hypothetical protein EC9_03190 [Rosistilla ulvae]